MTSLLIAHPDIPASAMKVSTSAAFDPDYPVQSTFYGERGSYGRLAANGTTVTVTFDLGTGNTRIPDHFILAGCYTLLYGSSATEATLQGSTDGSTWVNQLGTASDFLTRTFTGPTSSDLVFTAAFNDTYAASLAGYRHWRWKLTAGNSTKLPVSKVYCGTFFNMGSDPDDYDVEVVHDDQDGWRTPRGGIIMSKSSQCYHRVTLEWDGVSDAKAQEFAEKILARPNRNHVVLYTATHHDPLFGYRSMHCKVLADECSITIVDEDWRNITAVFEELRG